MAVFKEQKVSDNRLTRIFIGDTTLFDPLPPPPGPLHPQFPSNCDLLMSLFSDATFYQEGKNAILSLL